MTQGSRMSMAKVILTLFAVMFVVSNGKTFSHQEYLEMERELKRLNKPAVKVIKTKYGDIYDCVDIYKQPALDHPLLKNHNIQLEPSFTLEPPKRNFSGLSKEIDIMLPDGAQCPKGSVPFLRLKMEHLIREKSMPRKGNHLIDIDRNFSRKDGAVHLYAIVRTPDGGEYYGFRARFNVWGPQLTTNTQSSISQMWLYAGRGASLNAVETGWMVNPTVYPDHSVYLFTFFTPDGYKTACYDRRCGFILVTDKIPIPMLIRDVSIYNGIQQDFVLSIIKDPNTRHWWVIFGEQQIPVGYWPENLFPSMNNHATGFDFGGEVASATNEFPEMGSGHFPEEGYGNASFMSNIMLIDENNHLVDAPTNADITISNKLCYNIIDNPPSINPLGRHIFFGGPSGKCFG